MNHVESILNDHQRKVAEGGKNDEGRNKEMPISRRLEGLRSSRLVYPVQNFKAVLFRRVPRPDSPDLAGKITKNWGRDRRRRAKSPKAEKLAGGARGSHGVPRGSHGVPHQMLKSVARLGATLLSICAELRALRREAQASRALQN